MGANIACVICCLVRQGRQEPLVLHALELVNQLHMDGWMSNQSNCVCGNCAWRGWSAYVRTFLVRCMSSSTPSPVAALMHTRRSCPAQTHVRLYVCGFLCVCVCVDVLSPMASSRRSRNSGSRARTCTHKTCVWMNGSRSGRLIDLRKVDLVEDHHVRLLEQPGVKQKQLVVQRPEVACTHTSTHPHIHTSIHPLSVCLSVCL